MENQIIEKEIIGSWSNEEFAIKYNKALSKGTNSHELSSGTFAWIIYGNTTYYYERHACDLSWSCYTSELTY